MKPEFSLRNPARLAAFAEHYRTKRKFRTKREAIQAAYRGEWVCRVDNQHGGTFYVLKRFTPASHHAWIKRGTILGMWNELTFVYKAE